MKGFDKGRGGEGDEWTPEDAGRIHNEMRERFRGAEVGGKKGIQRTEEKEDVERGNDEDKGRDKQRSQGQCDSDESEDEPRSDKRLESGKNRFYPNRIGG